MSEHEQWGLEVACDLHAQFERSQGEHPMPLSEFAVGTSGPWLWAVYRLTSEFAGIGAEAILRGLVVDMRAATEQFALIGEEPLVAAVWFGEIAEPQADPEPPESTLLESVWWRCIPPSPGAREAQ